MDLKGIKMTLRMRKYCYINFFFFLLRYKKKIVAMEIKKNNQIAKQKGKSDSHYNRGYNFISQMII